MSNLHEGLKSLGVSAERNQGLYGGAVEVDDPFELLERFPSPGAKKDMNPHDVTMYVNLETSEFTSLCPMTGQPDFATIKIRYLPDQHCVESKSLKLYFLGFRNQREFHESCIVKICNDLVKLLDPLTVMVKGEFTARGGIPIWPTAHYVRPGFDDTAA